MGGMFGWVWGALVGAGRGVAAGRGPPSTIGCLLGRGEMAFACLFEDAEFERSKEPQRGASWPLEMGTPTNCTLKEPVLESHSQAAFKKPPHLPLKPKRYPFDIPTEAFPFERFRQAFAAVQASVVHLQARGGALPRLGPLLCLGPRHPPWFWPCFGVGPQRGIGPTGRFGAGGVVLGPPQKGPVGTGLQAARPAPHPPSQPPAPRHPGDPPAGRRAVSALCFGADGAAAAVVQLNGKGGPGGWAGGQCTACLPQLFLRLQIPSRPPKSYPKPS